MRKFVFILIIAVLFLFSGCNLIHFGGGSNKPSPSVSTEPSPKPSIKPSPSVEPTPPPEETSLKPSQATGGHVFGGGGSFSSPAANNQDIPDASVQDAQLQKYADQSLSSRDDVVYTGNASVRADYDGDGTKEILNIDFLNGPDSDEMNNPLTITLTIGGSSVVYEDTWNDSVAVGITDFDTSDPELDIYIISFGTDVSAYVITYWYDGTNVEEFESFDIIEDTAFWYDTQGYIYYRGQYEEAYGVMVGLNFYTGEVFTVD